MQLTKGYYQKFNISFTMCHKIFLYDNIKIEWPNDACAEINYIMHSWEVSHKTELVVPQ